MPGYCLKHFVHLVTPLLLSLTPSVLPKIWCHVLPAHRCTAHSPSRLHLTQSDWIDEFVQLDNGITVLGLFAPCVKVVVANTSWFGGHGAWFMARRGWDDGDVTAKSTSQYLEVRVKITNDLRY
jgi:hypothetical protein